MNIRFSFNLYMHSIRLNKYLFLLALCFLFPFLSKAKISDSLSHLQHKEFFLNWDNDMFVFKDYYYTQGAYLNFIHPKLKKNPANYLLIRLKNSDHYYGLGIAQQIFTPKDVADTLLNLVDRPYAGTLFISSFISSSIPEKKMRVTSRLNLGVLGPLAGAKQAQKYIHDWLDLGWPLGWDFQIKNRPYINYNLLLEKGLIAIPGSFNLVGNSRVRAGTVHDDIQIDLGFRLGRTNDLFKGYNLGNNKYAENRDFEIYLFGNTKITTVFYNATLMGGIVHTENEKYFEFNDIENFLFEACLGLQMNYKFAGVSMQFTWKSKEFEMGEQHGWGTFSIFTRF